MLFKLELFNDYKIDIVDKTFEGILVMKIIDKISEYSILLIGTYLPPEQSKWGRDASGFFTQIMTFIYQYAEFDGIYICGDVNSRLGNKQDFVPEIDISVKPRKIIDKTSNSHGTVLHEFLLDSKMCFANGRITPENDNYTYVATTGLSVVDYFMMPIDLLEQCVSFHVYTARSLINKFCNIRNMDIDIPGKIPDHSVLQLKIYTGYSTHAQNSESDINANESNEKQEGNDKEFLKRYYLRYNVRNIKNDFMQSEVCRQAILLNIDKILESRALQSDIDKMCDDFCNSYYDEMGKCFKIRNIYPQSKKRLKRSVKPFWNDNLQNLWKVLCKNENEFIKAKGNHRNLARHNFKTAQKEFDKMYRKNERAYQYQKQIEIEEINTNDPNKFWETLKNLGPRKRNVIPFEIYNEDGNLTSTHNEVLNKWKSDFDQLYSFNPESEEFDDDFYNWCIMNSEIN